MWSVLHYISEHPVSLWRYALFYLRNRSALPLAIIESPSTKEMKILKHKAAAGNELPSTSGNEAMDETDAVVKAKACGEAAANSDNSDDEA
jgi:hypothetical protein